MASTSASAQLHRWTYDVFVSFRGEDIRKTFMGNLYKDFRQKGINAFRDDDEILRGEELPPELYKAIEESWFLIVVFSKDFASSSWCLRELTKILERKRMAEPKHEVRFVFYDIKPDVVRKQSGSYAEAFIKHEISNTTEVSKWKEALREATDIIGCDLQDFANGYESKLIDHISKDILDMTYRIRSMDVGEKVVGVDDQIEKMDLSRFNGPDKVHMLGICGISGIGKTTLAKAIYNKMCMDFKGCCFFENVQGVAKTKSITEVQMQIINSILKTRVETITNVSDGIKLIKGRMASKPILLILDDVDDWEQLKALAGSHDWFFPGSLIIFTGKDQQLLRSHRVDDIYDMPVLPGNKAMELFSLYAFGKRHPTKEFKGLSKQVVKCLQGHPLALRVLGACLYEKPMNVWQSEVDKLQTCPKEDIQQKLRPSFDGLDFNEKRIFLDIACSLIGENKDIVASVLGNGNSFVYADMEVLVNKSLITISRDDNSLQMHELIRSMARRIMHEELVVNKVWSRLWNLSEVCNELRKNKAIKAVEVLDLFLKRSIQNIRIYGEAFEDMKNLRILKISYVEVENFWEDSKVTYSGRLKSLSNKLRLLYWHGCPFEFPSDFYPENIVAIDLSYSHLKTLWTTPKCFGRLKVMKLRHCRNLTNTPDFTMITNLEELILEGCVNLVKVHPSFGMLKKLVILNMRDCKRFRRFPCKIEMDSLEVLHLSGCSKLDKLPEFFSTIQTLKELYFDGTTITELPSFVFSQCNLQVLEFGLREKKRPGWWTTIPQPSWLPSKIHHPQSLQVMPSSLADLCFLRELKLRHCNISQVSDSIRGLSCLQSLDLDGNNFTSFPARCLSQLSHLEYLSLSGCKKLEVLPQLPPNLNGLNASFCLSLHELQGKFRFNNSFATTFFDGCPKLFKNLSVESQLCMPQPRPDLNSSITNQISTFLQFMEFPSNTCGIFGGQERQLSVRYLDIVYHGNIIPQWFTNTSMGNHIKVELPPNFCYNKVRGYGICVVLMPKNSYGRNYSHCMLSYHVDNCDGTSLVQPHVLYYGFEFHESDIILFHFMKTVHWEWEETKNFVTFSFEGNDAHEVKTCGVRLVFDEDIQGEETSLSITQDLPTPTQDGGHINVSVETGRYTGWSW